MTELRSLSPSAFRRVLAKHDRQQRMFDELVRTCVALGVFNVSEPALAARAIVTMCTGVAYWYERSGPLSPDDSCAPIAGRRSTRRGPAVRARSA